ncbi:hypothetical protein K2173_010814 [Erythroxylum novogranatense]|uniref:Uncharacterized protein n=1 Tax=Erythroxylum novogranatense TaxID=1862640 RepID=A0AAV8T091_9ROSI|nr:hypothetical protein K2173_010814 [Erythroxylum novogranatense]
MRHLFCKIHCPSFICFCKPSAGIYTPGPLKLENSPHPSSTPAISVADVSSSNHMSVKFSDTNEEILDVDGNKTKTENFLKSSLKREVLDSKEVDKKRVQWMDLLGKELIEVREFQPSEAEDLDSDDQRNRSCVCTIL